MLLSETKSNIGHRMRALNPTWLLGIGADLGEELNKKSRKIALIILTEVFYRELYEYENRTKEDLHHLAHYVINDFLGLSCSREISLKIIENLMWSKSKNYSQFSFRDEFYDENKDVWLEHRFQFLTLDRTKTIFDEDREVYSLTEESQEIVIKSHELEAEFNLTVSVMLAEMLVARGRYDKAITSLQHLDTKVRRLIEKEKEHKKQIMKDPKTAIYLHNMMWGDHLDDVRVQFQEELSRYREMERIISSEMEITSRKSELFNLLNRVNKTRQKHDKLAQLVISNIEREFRFRSDPIEFTKLWRGPRSSFKNTVMEKQIIPKGVKKPDDIFKFINILFSPKRPFIYPLQWMVKEQGLREKEIDFDNCSDGENNFNGKRLEVEWDSVVELWTPIFELLLKHGEVSITHLLEQPDNLINKWICNREAFDFWLLFSMEREVIDFSQGSSQSVTDQKLQLVHKVVESNEQLVELKEKQLEVFVLNRNSIRIGDTVEFPPLKLKIR
ncbi:hypothetical protein [Pseudalkalibacillus hwajinpoensis]|uniref:hypothetical protein n=1 Tax=Guptibacillus hwajinpoensis TaxID=208199 RepID=UPI0038508CBE